MRFAKSPYRNWTGERFTLICNGFFHAAASRQASRRVHSPISTIKPFCSARAMKVLGGTRPCLGCSQRARTSNPKTSPSTVACGW